MYLVNALSIGIEKPLYRSQTPTQAICEIGNTAGFPELDSQYSLLLFITSRDGLGNGTTIPDFEPGLPGTTRRLAYFLTLLLKDHDASCYIHQSQLSSAASA